MLRLGVTGGIGSGKSSVCKIFEYLGVKVYHADERAKWLVENIPALREAIVGEFGEKSFEGRTYNRLFIASVVFSNKERLSKLNELIHPFVLNDWAEFCTRFSSEKYVVKEAAIMLETDSKNTVDKVVLVFAPEELRIKRVIKREGAREDEIRARMSNQMPEKEKAKLSDYAIINDEEHSLIEQVLLLHNTMGK